MWQNGLVFNCPVEWIFIQVVYEIVDNLRTIFPYFSIFLVRYFAGSKG